MEFTYYFSKWGKEWILFKNQPPSIGELNSMKKYNYKIKIKIENENQMQRHL